MTWSEWVPPAVNTDLGCEEGQLDPTIAPGLGEGSIIQAPNGDIIAMTWFPYPSVDGVDQFYAILGKKTSSTEIEWEWCWNSADKEPFYGMVPPPLSAKNGVGFFNVARLGDYGRMY